MAVAGDDGRPLNAGTGCDRSGTGGGRADAPQVTAVRIVLVGIEQQFMAIRSERHIFHLEFSGCQ